jgi:hypothetical protein
MGFGKLLGKSSSATKRHVERTSMLTCQTNSWVPAKVMAPLLGLEPDALLRFARDGVLPSARLGHRTVRFNVAEVLRAMADRQRGSVGAAAGQQEGAA